MSVRLAWGVALIFAISAPFWMSGYHLYQFSQVLIYAIALLGLNLLTGYNGQLSLGHGAFFAIGAIAGMMAAPIVYLDPNMMGGILLYAFAGAVLGGIDNPWGAVFGGFAVGIAENLLGAYVVGEEVKLSVALVIIVGVLVARPSGLFGRRIVARV